MATRCPLKGRGRETLWSQEFQDQPVAPMELVSFSNIPVGLLK